MAFFKKRLFDYLKDQLNNYPQEKAFGQQINGNWQYYSTAEMVDLTDRLSIGLLRNGIKAGDRVATVVHKTTPEWVALDFAMLQIGVINVPMYPTISPREYAYILQESESKICFVGDEVLLEKVQTAKLQCPQLKEILLLHKSGSIPSTRNLESILPAGNDLNDIQHIRTISSRIKSEDLATIIYTSGTTGNPKRCHAFTPKLGI